MSGASSPGWETVVSSKTVKSVNSKTGGKNAAANAAKKKFVAKAPRLEDVLPMDQVNAYYNAQGVGKNQAPPPAPTTQQKESPSKPEQNKKKAGKLKKARGYGDVKGSKPTTFKEALERFSSKEFAESLDHVKALYTNNPSMWLREAGTLLNEVLACQLPAVSTESDLLSGQPLELLTKDAKKSLNSILSELDDSSMQASFETLLATVGHDMNKDEDVNGYIVILQQMNETDSQLATRDTTRLTDIIKSYQNRPKICLTILWILGQSGSKDLGAGLRAWIEYMRPVLKLRHYSKFVVNYLKDLLKYHQVASNMNRIKEGRRILYTDQFFKIFDSVFTEAPVSVSKDLVGELEVLYPTLKELAIDDCSMDHDLFPEFLKRLDDKILLSEGSKTYHNALLNGIGECVANNSAAVISHWQQMYRAHLTSSSVVLTHLADKYDILLKPSPYFKNGFESFEELLEAFQDYNSGCSTQRDGLQESKAACKKILEKMALQSQHTGQGWFPWKTLILLLVLGTGVVVNHDIQNKGSFDRSNIGHLLKDAGLFDHTVRAYDFSTKTYASGRKWVEVNVPIYYNKTVEVAGPYAKKAMDQTKVLVEKAKVLSQQAVDGANKHLPGLVGKAKFAWSKAKIEAAKLWKWLQVNGPLIGEKIVAGVRHAMDSVQLTITQIVNGELELKDIYHGFLVLGERSVEKVQDLRRSILG